MSTPAEAGRPDEETPVGVQLDRVKAQIDEVHGDLVHTIDALRGVLDTEQRQTQIQPRATRATQAERTELQPRAAGELPPRATQQEKDTERPEVKPDKHYWPCYTAQMKQEAMYVLRKAVREFDTVEAGYEAVKEKLDEKLETYPESLLDEALLAKDQNRGMSLLSFAAQQGNEDWFNHILRRIRQKFDVGLLVKELRAWDINGAPILFQAASSRTKHECFDTVCHALRILLTRSGLIEQIIAHDHRGRNLLMHAARSNHVAVFKQVKTIFDRYSPFPKRKNLLLRDHTGRTILHHAAEAGCSKILREVMRSLDDDDFSELSRADENGRTPIMHVLRVRHGYEDDGDLEKQFEMLCERTGPAGWMQQRRVLHPEEVPELRGITVEGTTELMHAARGGYESLQLALAKIRKIEGDPVVSIDTALKVTFHPPTTGTSLSKEAWGWGMLLAAAARGGHVDVLNAVVYAIENGKFAEPGGRRPESTLFQRPPEEKKEEERGHEDGTISDSTHARRNRLKEAVDAISESGRSIYTLAVVSGKNEAVEWVDNFVRKNFNDKGVWKIVRGKYSQTSPITCAAAASIEDDGHGVRVFDTVFRCLEQAAVGRWPEHERKGKLIKHLIGRWKDCRITPLAASAFRSNWILFQKIYDLYESLSEDRWSRNDVRDSFPDIYSEVLTGGEHTAMHEHSRHKFASFESQTTRLSAVMWREILEAFERADSTNPSQGSKMVRSRREEFKSYSKIAVKLAIEERTFDNLRDLVREGFPLHDDVIPKLLLHIEDHEEDVICIVMFAIGNASNPLVMAAGVSKSLKLAERASPMHRGGLRRLQMLLDDLTNELLDKLPHTVRGMGTTLLKSVFRQDQYGQLDAAEQRRRDTLCNLAGFIAVEWILTPRLIIHQTELGDNYNGPSYLDPLSYALDRGSEALKFINSPLVLDYVHVKFSCSLPHWSSANPFKLTINQGFYKYRHFDSGKYENGEHGTNCIEDDSWDAFLLRFLQGWDHRDMNGESDDKNTLEVDQPSLSDTNGKPHGRDYFGTDHHEPSKRQSCCPGFLADLKWDRFPHVTLLPGLQFSLAGILGKPQTFYQVPAVRFMFELFSYLVLVGLFCSSVILEDSKRIPSNEALFYLFVAGTLWREVLEFADGIPGRMPPQGRRQRGQSGDAETQPSDSEAQSGHAETHPSDAARGTPNIAERNVDASGASERTAHSRATSMASLPGPPSVMDTGGAHVASAEGLNAGDSGAPSHASKKNGDTVSTDQPTPTPMSASTSKSRVKGMGRLAVAARRYIGHDTWNLLDAMTVVCVLVAFIARLLAMPMFGGPADPGGSFFVAQVFLAFSAPLFFARLLLLPQIDGTLGPMTQIIWKMMSQTLRFSVFLVIFMASFALSFHALFHNCNDDSELGESFGNFHQALVVVFGAPLGDFSFQELFDGASGQCPDHASPEWVGDVGTLLLVAYLVVMAVILFNLLIAILSTAHYEVHRNGEQEFHVARTRLILQSSEAVARRRIAPPLNLLQIIPGLLFDAASEMHWWYKCLKMRFSEESFDSVYKPFTSSFLWYTMEGLMQRVLFALTMGVAALLLSALLWTVSLPFVAWNIIRWVASKEMSESQREKKRQWEKQRARRRRERVT
eukprot:g8052.t1